MKDRKRVRKILSQHLGLKLAREVPTKIEDTEREIGEAGHLRDYTCIAGIEPDYIVFPSHKNNIYI
jgi:hypothetical protein